MSHKILLISLSFLIFIFACKDSDIKTISTLNPPVSGSGTIAHTSAEGGDWPFTYTHEIGSTPKDVYFIFTNPTYNTEFSEIQIQSNNQPINANLIEEKENSLNQFTAITKPIPTTEYTIPANIREFNSNPPPMMPIEKIQDGLTLDILETPVPSFATVGDTLTFNESINTSTVDSTIQATRTIGPLTVNIWVADIAYDVGCGLSKCMTRFMAEEFLDKFLIDGTSDVYGWMKNMIGVPWGSHNKSNLIPETAKNSIDILFYDIPVVSGGTIIGYYHAKDNYLTASESTSNQRLIFYMDSILAATESGTWDITDQYPALVLSTLSHEFQHMINFYQKAVLRSGGSAAETWLNEMSSLMSEDLMSDKLQVDGPRGVAYNDYSDGSAGNADGRLPIYTYYNDKSVVNWDATYSYSINYALGAYLLRNYGGSGFLKKLVQSPYTNTAAIDYALSQMGYGLNFSDVLQRWGISTLLSNQLNAPTYYRYNNGDSFDSTTDSFGYKTGSINMYNYTYSGQTGPKIYSIYDLPNLNYHNAASNILVKAASQKTGTLEWTIRMARNTKLSVVLK